MDDNAAALRDAYLDLLGRSLLGFTVAPTTLYRPKQRASGRIGNWILRALQRRGGPVLAAPSFFDPTHNEEGTASVWDLPPWPMTMIGSVRLKNVEKCVRDVLEAGVPGHLIETGVWRGGTTIFMRGVLRAYGVTDRSVFVADSFAGVPPPDVDAYPADAGTDLHLWPGLAVSAEEVRANFSRYGLLDNQVRFVEGWFRETLPTLRDLTWAVIRLDGDLYESTMDSLQNLYGGLAPGGWLIVDDYERAPCRKAVHDFREREGIREPVVKVDWTGICWQKEG
jgi:hypothetical protein